MHRRNRRTTSGYFKSFISRNSSQKAKSCRGNKQAANSKEIAEILLLPRCSAQHYLKSRGKQSGQKKPEILLFIIFRLCLHYLCILKIKLTTCLPLPTNLENFDATITRILQSVGGNLNVGDKSSLYQ